MFCGMEGKCGDLVSMPPSSEELPRTFQPFPSVTSAYSKVRPKTVHSRVPSLQSVVLLNLCTPHPGDIDTITSKVRMGSRERRIMHNWIVLFFWVPWHFCWYHNDGRLGEKGLSGM